MLKAKAWPLSREVPHLAGRGAERSAATRPTAFAPSMRQRIDLAEVYRRALRALPETIDGEAPLPMPDVCPVTLDELLSDGPAA